MQLALPCAINSPLPKRGRGRGGQFLIITASLLSTFHCNKGHAWEKYRHVRLCKTLLNNLSGKKLAHARRAWGSIRLLSLLHCQQGGWSRVPEMPKCNANPLLFLGWTHEVSTQDLPTACTLPWGGGLRNRCSARRGQIQPAMLPPSNPSSCHHQPGTWSRSATTDWRTLLINLFIYSLLLPALSLSPAPSRTGRLLPHSQHGISEVRTRPSPLPRRGSTLFSSMLWDLRIIWRLSGRDGRSCCWPHGWYTQPYFQFAQEATCPQPVAQFATFICR